MHKCCANCEYCIHIPGDEGDEWYCRIEHMDVDDAYFDVCKVYKKKEEK